MLSFVPAPKRLSVLLSRVLNVTGTDVVGLPVPARRTVFLGTKGHARGGWPFCGLGIRHSEPEATQKPALSQKPCADTVGIRERGAPGVRC